jgi:hypothetical protein
LKEQYPVEDFGEPGYKALLSSSETDSLQKNCYGAAKLNSFFGFIIIFSLINMFSRSADTRFENKVNQRRLFKEPDAVPGSNLFKLQSQP